VTDQTISIIETAAEWEIHLPAAAAELALSICPKDDIRPILNHILVDIETGKATAADGFMLGQVPITAISKGVPARALIHRESIARLRRVAGRTAPLWLMKMPDHEHQYLLSPHGDMIRNIARPVSDWTLDVEQVVAGFDKHEAGPKSRLGPDLMQKMLNVMKAVEQETPSVIMFQRMTQYAPVSFSTRGADVWIMPMLGPTSDGDLETQP
jgi:hypothetical protein